MKYFILFFVPFFVTSAETTAQKKVVDNNTSKTWTSLKDIENQISKISNDGNYVAYVFGDSVNGDSLQLKSIDGKYIRSYKINNQSAGDPKIEFSEDSKKLRFLISGDTLNILTLGTDEISHISNVHSFKTSRDDKWIVYYKTSPDRELVIQNLTGNTRKIYTQAQDYLFINNKELLIITMDSLIRYNLTTKRAKTIYRGTGISKVTLNESNRELAFISMYNNSPGIFIYRFNSDTATILIGNGFSNTNNIEIADDEIRFTPDGKKIFFSINTNDLESQEPRNISKKNFTIWNSTDKFIGKKNFESENYRAVLNVKSNEIIQLTNAHTTIFPCGNMNSFVITVTKENETEFYWNNAPFYATIISLENGRQKKIDSFSNRLTLPSYYISPSNNFVVWFDYDSKQFISYEISSGIVKNISKAIPFPVFDYESDIPARRYPFGIGGWLKNDNILINDKFDIWQVDLKELKKPINITNGQGRLKDVIIRNVDVDDIRPLNQPFLLSLYNISSKKNGFCMLSQSEKFTVNANFLGNYAYYGNSSNQARGTYVSNYQPIKAKNKNIFLVYRMSNSESPNLFITYDFINYKKITFINPESDYSWMASELISWKLPNGKNAQGILYKPENLDRKKKYPIIFHYYEKNSDELNVFKMPKLSYGELNIPFYVSNGYLVFVPDMQYETSRNVESISESILSAVNLLKQYTWIDRNKMGLQGHSFGGYETLVILTNTNIFKAAQESAGPANLTSFYSHINGYTNRQSFSEWDQINLGTTPWEHPDIYINNSPIFIIDKVKAPLLIMHGKIDHIVSLSQSTDLYSALRRLKKPVWLLQYEEESHTLRYESNMLDFTIKQKQFFDYYLKDGPKPEWME